MTTAPADRVADLLGRFPGPLVLRSSTAKWFRLLAIGLVFVVLGAAIIWNPETFGGRHRSSGIESLLIGLGLARDGRAAMLEMGWGVVTFFGAGCLISIVVLLPGASQLTLDRRGFMVRSLFRRRDYSWQDVGEFGTWEFKNRMVVFNRHPGSGGMASALNVKLTGRDSALPDTYGLAAEDLVQLMVLWRERALQNRPSSPG